MGLVRSQTYLGIWNPKIWGFGELGVGIPSGPKIDLWEFGTPSGPKIRFGTGFEGEGFGLLGPSGSVNLKFWGPR